MPRWLRAGLPAAVLVVVSACTGSGSDATAGPSSAAGPATPIIVALESQAASSATPQPTARPTAAHTASPSSTATAQATPVPQPTGTQSAAQKALVAAFQKKFGSATFQAQGPVTGTGTMSFADITGTGPITGTFKMRGPDSQVTTTTTTTSTTAKAATTTASVATTSGDDIRLGTWEYLREFGGPWQRRPAGPSFQDLVRVGALQDHGVEARLGSQLHRLVPSVSLVTYVSTMGFGVPAGVTVSKLDLSFWAKDDGTPAGMTIAMTATGRLADQQLEVVDTIDIRFTTFAGIVITAPSTWVDASPRPS